MAARIPTQYDDIIDSRDVIEAIDDLSTDEDSLDDEERAMLADLRALAEEASGYAADWEYGESLIRDSYFTQYAEELADDLGIIDASASWPLYCIDWERAARDLQMDYTSVEFAGVTYWIR